MIKRKCWVTVSTSCENAVYLVFSTIMFLSESVLLSIDLFESSFKFSWCQRFRPFEENVYWLYKWLDMYVPMYITWIQSNGLYISTQTFVGKSVKQWQKGTHVQVIWSLIFIFSICKCSFSVTSYLRKNVLYFCNYFELAHTLFWNAKQVNLQNKYDWLSFGYSCLSGVFVFGGWIVIDL